MTRDEIAAGVTAFIRENFIFDDRTTLRAGDSLIQSGTVDSTGILELIAFIERTYAVRFEDAELTAENFDSVDRITSCVAGKLGA